MVARMAAADASGSPGRRVTTVPEAGPTLEASMPPLAHTNPCGVSVMITPLAMRTMRRASRRTTSTWRGSRSQRSANAIASGRGSIAVRSTIAPSALLTDLLGHDQDVVVAQRQDVGARRGQRHRR